MYLIVNQYDNRHHPFVIIIYIIIAAVRRLTPCDRRSGCNKTSNFKDRVAKKKGRDLTQSYDKSPYTSRIVKRAKCQHKQRHKKVRLHSGCGPT